MIPTTEQLDAAIAAGHVKRVDQGPLSIYNYTPRCTFDSAWDEVTCACRGLVLNRETGEVVALPWPKFFNHGQPEAGPVPEGNPVVTVKLDGSLGISYRYEGQLRWTTRGTFFSPQAAVAQRIWDERYSHVEVPLGWTVMVEIISPDTRVVVRYDYEDIIVLGIRDRSGPDLPQETVEKWAASVGLRVTERVPHDLGSAIRTAAELDEQHEGFVLRWGSYRRKVKGHAYLRIARFLQGLTERRIADMWYFGDTEALALVPEEYRGEVERVYAEMDALEQETLAAVQEEYNRISHLETRKEMAIALKARNLGPLFGLAMAAAVGDRHKLDFKKAAYRSRFPGGMPRSGGST